MGWKERGNEPGAPPWILLSKKEFQQQTQTHKEPLASWLCPCIRQLCSPAAGSLQLRLINPDSNQRPDAAQVAAVSLLPGCSPIPDRVTLLPREGRIPNPARSHGFQHFDGEGPQGDTAAWDRLADSQSSRDNIQRYFPAHSRGHAIVRCLVSEA